MRTPRGRVATGAAWRHFGLAAPATPDLFGTERAAAPEPRPD